MIEFKEVMCRHCGKMHKGEGLPPSLRGKVSTCRDCYKTYKYESDNAWRKRNPDLIRKYKLKWMKEHQKEVAENWKERTRKWKENTKKRKLKPLT